MKSGAWVATTRDTREWSTRIMPAPVSSIKPRATWHPSIGLVAPAGLHIHRVPWAADPAGSHPGPLRTPINRGRTLNFRYGHFCLAKTLPLPLHISILADLSIGVPTANTTPVSPSFRVGVAAKTISGINILVLEGGRRAFPATSTSYRERSQRARPQAMAEQDNQDFHDDDPTPTGSRGTQRTQRGRSALTRRRPSQTEILAGNVRDLIELVRALVDTRRDANFVQFPEEPPEVAESTPS
ncbi:hypothetical protein TIFTF001_034670 [Ficus carica]|uniref:Uncharacterized protein n=1 Tax=Ficus carica TaxID=3494 RepID=A0AA88E3B4_FICCA|nr:hypothetical protein TIFTF001_034670 [Ficus carica]